jgi:hypothetical protein
MAYSRGRCLVAHLLANPFRWRAISKAEGRKRVPHPRRRAVGQAGRPESPPPRARPPSVLVEHPAAVAGKDELTAGESSRALAMRRHRRAARFRWIARSDSSRRRRRSVSAMRTRFRGSRPLLPRAGPGGGLTRERRGARTSGCSAAITVFASRRVGLTMPASSEKADDGRFTHAEARTGRRASVDCREMAGGDPPAHRARGNSEPLSDLADLVVPRHRDHASPPPRQGLEPWSRARMSAPESAN